MVYSAAAIGQYKKLGLSTWKRDSSAKKLVVAQLATQMVGTATDHAGKHA